jgi:hypothetical protein
VEYAFWWWWGGWWWWWWWRRRIIALNEATLRVNLPLVRLGLGFNPASGMLVLWWQPAIGVTAALVPNMNGD